MDPSLPMILPKGIVVNTVNVYKEVASHSIIPADRIYEYWHVYTTTNKRLKDPTARRLENFWWHVWGSDRRLLRGSTLAKIYEDISVGPTVIPLRGPPNRWEGPDVPPLTKQMILSRLPPSEQSRNSPFDAKPSGPLFKSLVSNDCKPPQLTPILKKPRGPSASGPRPTARFISPHESDNDGDKNCDLLFPGSTVAMGSEIASPPGLSSRKYSTPTQPPSLAAGPAVFPKGTNSPPTAASELSPQEGIFLSTSRTPRTPRAVSPIPEASLSLIDLESFKPGRHPQPEINPKVVGKMLSMQQRTTEPHESLEQQSHSLSLLHEKSAVARHSGTKLSGFEKSKTDGMQDEEDDAPPSESTQGNGPTSIMGRSHSHAGYGHVGEPAFGKALNQALFTRATASTTHVAAQGTIIDQSGVGSIPASTVMDRQLNEYDLGQSASSLLESRLTPTQPSSTASLPLGRTKSQLTLLLERERAKNGDRSRSGH